MADAPNPMLPRAALERVLARAAELQQQEPSSAETISEARLLEIATEVGLEAAHIRQAIAEERTATGITTQDAGFLLDALGLGAIGVQRTMAGTPLALLDRFESLLPRLERLAVVRRFPDRLVLEPRHDPIGNLLRSVGVQGRRFDLLRVDALHVTATRVDDARVVLRIDAVLHGARRAARTNVLAVAGVLAFLCAGFVVPVTLFALMVPSFALATALLLTGLAIAGTAWAWHGFRRGYRALTARVTQRLEALLDDAEHGRLVEPPGLLDRLLT